MTYYEEKELKRTKVNLRDDGCIGGILMELNQVHDIKRHTGKC